jgi:hypothetical protein
MRPAPVPAGITYLFWSGYGEIVGETLIIVPPRCAVRKH